MKHLSAAEWLIVAYLVFAALMYAFAGLLARSRRTRAQKRMDDESRRWLEARARARRDG